jgi:aminoglycoside phosphotransferase (APT) family kinase protein
VPREQALAWWEASSGRRIDHDALHWWEVFACVKGIAIWTTAAKRVAEGQNSDYLMLGSGWWATDVHLQALASIFHRKLEEGLL